MGIQYSIPDAAAIGRRKFCQSIKSKFVMAILCSRIIVAGKLTNVNRWWFDMSPKYKNIFTIIICASLLLLSCKVARAQSADTKATKAKTSAKSSESDAKTSKIGRWAVSIRKTDKGGPQVEIRLEASEPYTASDGSDLNTADLVIGCTRGQTVAFLDWKARLVNDNNDASTMYVSYSLDSSPSLNSDWDISSDRRSLISKRSVEFIQSLNGKRRLELLLVPDGLGQETIIFNLANLDAVLKLVGDQCYN